MEVIMKTIKNTLFAFLALLALGITMEPIFGMGHDNWSSDTDSEIEPGFDDRIDAIEYNPFNILNPNENGIGSILAPNHMQSLDIDSPAESELDDDLLNDLFNAINAGDLNTVRYIIDNHPEYLEITDLEDNTPLYLAILSNNQNIIAYLLEKGADVTIKDAAGNTPLHYAVMELNFEAVKCLIDLGADVNVKTDGNDSPLHLAVDLLHQNHNPNTMKIIQFLVKHGANLDDQNDFAQYTPLHIACLRVDFQAIKFLVNNGSDLTLRDINDETAYDVAIDWCEDDSQQLLDYAQQYNDHKTIIEKTPENEDILPDYLALAIAKQDIKDIMKFQRQEPLCSPYLSHYIKLANRLNKQESLKALVWLKLSIKKEDGSLVYPPQNEFERGIYKKQQRIPFFSSSTTPTITPKREREEIMMKNKKNKLEKNDHEKEH